MKQPVSQGAMAFSRTFKEIRRSMKDESWPKHSTFSETSISRVPATRTTVVEHGSSWKPKKNKCRVKNFGKAIRIDQTTVVSYTYYNFFDQISLTIIWAQVAHVRFEPVLNPMNPCFLRAPPKTTKITKAATASTSAGAPKAPSTFCVTFFDI